MGKLEVVLMVKKIVEERIIYCVKHLQELFDTLTVYEKVNLVPSKVYKHELMEKVSHQILMKENDGDFKNDEEARKFITEFCNKDLLIDTYKRIE